ncbi:MAG: indolepyruvate oxidoreductase subunit beta [Planctomycetes bacterium]|nr:indolepyruvate oxidoreductase subunit beta [Planctomycetota bacterium]
MEFNILLAGVGGQGILTITHAISHVAMQRGYHVKQSEEHGMSQRGGAVQTHLRLADHPISSDLIPLGQADLLLAVEPLELLRYSEYLSDGGTAISNSVPVANIDNYPPIDNVLDRIARLGQHVLIQAQRLAKVAGSPRAENMVMLGAAVRFMEFPPEDFARHIAEIFASKGERVVATNRRALLMGFHGAALFRDALRRGQTSRSIRKWMALLPPDQLANLADRTTAKGLRQNAFEIPTESLDRIKTILLEARMKGRDQLFEQEVYEIIDLAGAIAPPRHHFVRSGEDITDDAINSFPSERIVMKIVSPQIVHKSDAGGIVIVPKDPDKVRTEIDNLIAAQSKHADQIEGVLLVELVEHAQRGMGSELFVGIRQTREFGPVIAAGLGGVDTEYMAERLKSGIAVAKAPAIDTSPEAFFELFKKTAAYEILSGNVRGRERVVGDGELLHCFQAFIAIARQFCLDGYKGLCIEELEVNPFAFRRQQMVPLDGRGRLGRPMHAPRARPLERVTQLLEPRSIAVVGVSSKRNNFGRIILNNTQACGFPKNHLYVIKENEESIDGVPCYPSVSQLPERVDLLVAATSATRVPELVEEVLATDSPDTGCASVILIPGGLGEKEGTQDVQRHLRVAIEDKRCEKDGAPVFLGGNCMGVRSRPGSYDTFFIPKTKLDPRRDAQPKRAAIISQSGAFIITRQSNLEFIDPQFSISVGNQVDLTVSDMLNALSKRDDLDCVGVYVEGFNDLDGLQFLRAVEQATNHGKVVVFYKAGRTHAGRSAAQGHTASVAGDYDVCQAAVTAAGAIVVDTFKEFEQVLELATDLHAKHVGGTRLGIISNAGYETVGMADTISGTRYEVEVGWLAEKTRVRLGEVLAKHELDSLVDPSNPLDLTPMASDAVYEDCIRAMLADDHVDAVIVGCVPMTPSLLTTPEEIESPDSIAARIPALFAQSDKPIVFVVDSMEPYNALARAVRSAGVPVFRSADQAVRSVGRYLGHRAPLRNNNTDEPTGRPKKNVDAVASA